MNTPIRQTVRQAIVTRFPWVWAIICMTLVIGCAALAVGWYGASRAADVGSCINTNLGQRSAPTQNDAQAHIDFARAIKGLFLPPAATPKQRAAEGAKFKRQVNDYVRTLLADQRERDAHPLGRC